MLSKNPFHRFLVLIGGIALLASCGGGGGGGSSSGYVTPSASPTYSISGAVSGDIKQGVTVKLNNTMSANTDAGGNYTFSGLSNGTYTITASKTSYSFTPTPNISVTINSANSTGNNFTATAVLYSLNGRVVGDVLGDVQISISGTTEGGAPFTTSTTTSAGTGSFSLSNLIPPGSYTVTPSKLGYTFNPVSSAATITATNITLGDFTASYDPLTSFSVSGTVNGDIRAGVLMTLTGAANATASTGGGGNYQFSVPNGGAYNIIPSKAGYTFSPTVIAGTISGADTPGHDFVATANLYSISGAMTGAALNGVTITVTGATEGGANITPVTMTTGANGSYSAGNLPNGAYTVTSSYAAANIYTFSPTSAAANVAAANTANVNFDVQLTADGYETSATGCTDDNTYQCSGTITVGETQRRTLYPDGDVDWARVIIPAGAPNRPYEFSANDLGNASDVVMSLYDCTDSFTGGSPPPPTLLVDGTTNPLVDDYIGLDSRIKYEVPAAGGIYCVKVEIVESVAGITGNGVTPYSLSVRSFVDADSDTFSSFYDCNDSNASVYPSLGVPGCPTAYNDAADMTGIKPDATAATSHPMAPSGGSGWEFQLRSDIFTANGRRFITGTDPDVFSIMIPAKSAVYVQVAAADLASFGTTINATQIDGSDAEVTLNSLDCYSSVGVVGNTCVLDSLDLGLSGLFISNTGTTAKTVYVKFDAGGDTGYYVPFYYNIGIDKDGDFYYTLDWPGLRDCNDGNSAINPGAADTTVDGIDQNCNGVDGS